MMQKLFLGCSKKFQKIAGVWLESRSGLKREDSDKIEQCDGSYLRVCSLTERVKRIVTPLISWIWIFQDGDKIFQEVKYDSPGPSKEEYLKKEAQIVNLQRQVAANIHSVEVLKSKVKSQSEEIQTKTAKIASLEVDVLAKKMEVCCLQSTNDSQNEEIDKLKYKIEKFEEKVTSLDADISGKARDIARLTCDAVERSEDVKSKRAQIISLTTEVKDKTDQIEQLEVERITETNHNLQNLNELESLSDQLANCEKVVQARDSEVATLRTEVHERYEELQEQDARIDNLKNYILTKDKLIANLKKKTTSQVSESRGKIEAIDENLSDLSSTISFD